jgi:hypothetical protein|tara:strand:- start:884 stop:1480 length:597 start_codon:yes stop_codon:yes gene_type:complete
MSAGAALLAWGVAMRIGTLIALHVVNNQRAVYLLRICCCANKRRANIASAHFDLAHEEGAETSAASALRERLVVPIDDPSADGGGAAAGADGEAARTLLDASALRFRSLSLRSRTSTLRFKLPPDCYEGQEIRVANPETGEAVAVTVPPGAMPGNFITVRYFSGEGEQLERESSGGATPAATRSSAHGYGALELASEE